MKRLKDVMRGSRFFLLGAALMTVLALTGCGATTVDLNKYITIEANGYNTMGTASYKFDMDAMIRDYKGKIKVNTKSDNALLTMAAMEGEDPTEMLLDTCIGEHLDKSNGLSNGDTVTLKWDCDDASANAYFNTVLKYSDIEYKVTGLKEVGTFDPFEYVKVSFSGVSPNGTITVTPDNSRPEMEQVSFTVDKKNGLKSGDSVTVKANISGSVDSFAQKYGVIPGSTEKTYKVEGLAKYVTELSEIPKEIYDKMDKQLLDNFNAHKAQSWAAEEGATIALVGNYFCKLKDGVNGNPANYIYYVYKVDYTHTGFPDLVMPYYWYGYFTDAMLLEDGTCTVDLSNYKASEASSGFFGMTSGDYLSVSSINPAFTATNYVAGYADLDTLFNKQIVAKIDKYEYTSTIK